MLNNTHKHTHLTALCPGLPGSAGTRKVKPIWILLKTVSGSGTSWAICKSAPHSTQITTPAPHHSVFCRPDALPGTQPTASKHWRQYTMLKKRVYFYALCYLFPSIWFIQIHHTQWSSKWPHIKRQTLWGMSSFPVHIVKLQQKWYVKCISFLVKCLIHIYMY